jgi:hypothetical protein
MTSTVLVPKDSLITGECYAMIMASGFDNQFAPAPVWQVGSPGDVGNVEISDIVFETLGPNPGAIMVEWNVAEAAQGSVGMWDVHWRIGGSAGTQLQSDTCSCDPNVTQPAVPGCEGAFLLLHVTSEASIYLENNWAWVADHELDRPDHNQLNIFNGRGILVESANGPVWMYGTSAEHSVLYNFQVLQPYFIPDYITANISPTDFPRKQRLRRPSPNRNPLLRSQPQRPPTLHPTISLYRPYLLNLHYPYLCKSVGPPNHKLHGYKNLQYRLLFLLRQL